jgi:acetate kinase
MFVHRLRKEIAAMAAVLGGLDVLVFTAGIGENSSSVRASTCRGLSFLGLDLDSQRNSASPADQEISTSRSSVRVLIIRAQEDWAIAQDCARVLRQSEPAARP